MVKELEAQNIQAKIDVVVMDITSDASVGAAIDHIKNTYGKPDGTLLN